MLHGDGDGDGDRGVGLFLLHLSASHLPVEKSQIAEQPRPALFLPRHLLVFTLLVTMIISSSGFNIFK